MIQNWIKPPTAINFQLQNPDLKFHFSKMKRNEKMKPTLFENERKWKSGTPKWRNLRSGTPEPLFFIFLSWRFHFFYFFYFYSFLEMKSLSRWPAGRPAGPVIFYFCVRFPSISPPFTHRFREKGRKWAEIARPEAGTCYFSFFCPGGFIFSFYIIFHFGSFC